MIRKIYLVKFDNGFDKEQVFTFKYCYKTKEQANKAIEELKQDKDLLKDYISSFDSDKNCVDFYIEFWIEELELVD